MRVSPFGHLRIKAYVRLPGAFRSLSRPSSAPSAKASALRSSSLAVPRHPPCALLRLTNKCLSTFLFYGSSLFTLELFYGLSRMSAGLSRLS